MGENNENVGVNRDIEYETKTVNDINGNPMEVYTTSYEHSAADAFGYGYQGKNTEVIICPENGATLVGIDGSNYCLYKDNGTFVEKYWVYVEPGKSLQDYAYLLTADTGMNEELGYGYGPNGELSYDNTTGGFKQTIKGPDGNSIDVCTANISDNSLDNPLSELETGFYTETNSESHGEVNLDTDIYSYLANQNNNPTGAGGIGIFQQGLYGNADISFPWVSLTSAADLENFQNENGFDSGNSYSAFCEEIAGIIETLDAQNIFFTNATGTQQKADLQSIIDVDIPQYQSTKEGISINKFKDDIVKYNDNVEEVKVIKTRELLEAACEQYNQQKHVLYYRTVGYEEDANGNSIPITEPVYDEIKYWGWIKWIHLLDMKESTMINELTSRGITVNIEERPADTKW